MLWTENGPLKGNLHRVNFIGFNPMNFYYFYIYFDISILTVNTNLTTPLKPKSIKPFRLQSVPNNKYIHTHILSKN
ncbi:hypothetical protein SFRURICE_015803 [Spodoptera frugiperda]|nr:hypothetical protein SFRURICE_015803 [Spodoptera frugiperda]